MILQALVRHYEDMLSRGEEKVPRLGWGKTKVSFGLNLNENGEVEGLIPLRVPQKVGKKEVMAPRTLEVPRPVKRAVDIKANFLCDNSTYLFGVDEKGKPERSKQCYQACREIHNRVLGKVETAPAKAILRYFESWNPDRAADQPFFAENAKELMAGINILFYYDGKSVLVDDGVRQAWQEYYNQTDGGAVGVCMVTGKETALATLHPVIKGVSGAQAMGTSLVSFNAPAFCSYEKEQGGNAPVGEYAAFAYAAALNELLDDREHKKVIGDTTVVYWAEGGETVYRDVGMAAMFGVSEKGVTDQELSMIFDKLRRGEQVKVEDQWLDTEKRFYVLGLAPNAARLTVRFFLVDSFGNMLKHVDEHYKRLEIVKPAYDMFQSIPLWKLLSETVNKNAKDKMPSCQMAADTLQAVLMGKPYPASLLNGVMIRIRAEKEVTRGRAAIIKAYYLRNKNKDCSKEEGVLEMELNEQCVNVSYTLGRLFAVLERIQEEANPGINATIKDKYFNAAASTPALVFPVLINLAQKHLRKMGDGRKGYFDNQIKSLMELVGEEFPKRLNLPKQGSFQLGYYCQTQNRYQKKEEK